MESAKFRGGEATAASLLREALWEQHSPAGNRRLVALLRAALRVSYTTAASADLHGSRGRKPQGAAGTAPRTGASGVRGGKWPPSRLLSEADFEHRSPCLA